MTLADNIIYDTDKIKYTVIGITKQLEELRPDGLITKQHIEHYITCIQAQLNIIRTSCRNIETMLRLRRKI